MILGDTIAAIATAPGRGGVAVVRVSGPDAFQVAERLTGDRFKFQETGFKFQETGFKFHDSGSRIQVRRLYMPNPETLKPETLNPETLNPETLNPETLNPETLNPETLKPETLKPETLKPETFIDEGVVLYFNSPRSYTGEDVVEFQCHGGAVTPRRVLEASLAAGARLARRGEFTERAFLNGKLDYDQAESVLDLVDAKTARAADAALEGLAGRKRRELKSLYESALDLSTKLEHALDVDEGEIPPDFLPSVSSSVSSLRSSLRQALRRAAEGKILREGALVVLAGPPNAGKSSLMNALLEENRAIVSDIPGTTRDSIEEWLDLGGWPIRLVDTAGLREAKDEVEVEGVRRAEDLIAKADVILWLGVSSSVSGLPSCVSGLPSCVSGLPSSVLPIHSKCDLVRGPGLNVSAKTGEGLDELKRTIVAKLEEKAATAAADTNVGSSDIAALQEALALLGGSGKGRETEDGRQEEDLVLLANAVRGAAERLGAALGATYTSDLLDNLFSRFCVGK